MNIQRYETKLLGVICDTCGFPTEVTIGRGPMNRYEEHRAGRADQCDHRNADGLLVDECPHWTRSLKQARELNEDGTLKATE
jgi:hypothetical protein